MSDSTELPVFVFAAEGSFGWQGLLARFVNSQLSANPECGLELTWRACDRTDYRARVVVLPEWLAQEDSLQRFMELLSCLGVGEKKIFFRAACTLQMYTALADLVASNQSSMEVYKSKGGEAYCELELHLSAHLDKNSQLWQKLFEVMCS